MELVWLKEAANGLPVGDSRRRILVAEAAKKKRGHADLMHAILHTGTSSDMLDAEL
jgi:hypothetical protein